MKKLWLLAGIIVLSGCLTMRSYTKEEPRKDLEVEGNQGYLSGEVKEEPRENELGDTRTISIVEVEFGPRKAKGNITQGVDTEESVTEEEIRLSQVKPVKPAAGVWSPEETEMQYYIIEKNDTLQKISRKFYGTTKKWNLLYEANKDILKNPDRLHPGVEIKIPSLE
jgi:LysM repeat protein